MFGELLQAFLKNAKKVKAIDMNKALLVFFVFFGLCLSIHCDAQTNQATPSYELFATLNHHENQVTSLCFSKNYLFSGDEIGTIQYCKTDGTASKVFEGHSAKITAISVAENEKFALTASYDGTINYWNVETQELLESFENPSIPPYGNKQGNEPSFVLFADGKTAYTGGYNLKVSKIDLETKAMTEIYTASDYAFTCGVLNKTQKELYVGEGNKIVALAIPTHRKRILWQTTDEKKLVCEMSYANNTLFVRFVAGGVACIDTQTGEEKQFWQASTLQGSAYIANNVSATLVLTGNSENQLIAYDANGTRKIDFLPKLTAFETVAITSQEVFVAAGDKAKIRVWKKKTPQIVQPNTLPNRETNGLTNRYENLEIGQQIVLQNLQFLQSDYVLQPNSKAGLDKVFAFLQQNQTAKIELGGHTDNVGMSNLNLALSQRRVLACKNYLVQKGIAEERIATVGYGDTLPIAANDSEETRKQNRRVEMKLLAM